jgi:hypothetical protein
VRAGRGRDSHAPADGETVGCEHAGTHTWKAHLGGHSARATRRRRETCCASCMTSATGSPSPIARRRQVRPNLWHMGVLQLHATNLRVAAHPLSIADDPMRGCRACRMCTMPILRNIQAPISCARSSPHLHCITRKKHVAPNACVRASRKLRARGKKPCLGCPTHNHALAPSESRNWLRSLCPQPYLIQSRATWQPGCLTPRDFFF